MAQQPRKPIASLGQIAPIAMQYDFAKPTLSPPVVAPIAPVSKFGLSDFGAQGNYLGPIAGAYGTYDLFSNDYSPVRSAAQGAASGAAIGSYFGMPWLGAGVGGTIGLTKGLFGGGESKTKIEEKRREGLAKQGISLGDIKQWELNPEFRDSRDESTLNAGDITNAATFYGMFGPQYNAASQQQKEAITGEALKRGLIREHHGTIDVTSTPQDFLDFANQTLATPTKSSSGSHSSSPSMPKEKKKRKGPPLVNFFPFQNPAPQISYDVPIKPVDQYATSLANYLLNKQKPSYTA